MSDKAIRAALEARLDLLAPALATAWENAPFKPTVGTPHQRVHLLRAEPENLSSSGASKRLSGFMQVMLFYPQNKGPGDAETRAEALRAHFPTALTLVNSGVSVVIEGTPYIMAGFKDGAWWAVPVRVPYFANIVS